MIGRVEGHRDCSRKERKGRKELNHEIHRIHGNGRARWSHRNPLSSVLRRQSFPLPREERRLTLLSYYCVTLTVSEGSDPKNTLEDLIANKKASGRAKDLADVEVLEGCRK